MLVELDPGAPVAHGDRDAIGFAADRQRDALAVGGVLDRVVDQVEHREGERVGIEPHHRQVGRDVGLERHVGGGDPARRQLDRAVDHLADVGVGELVDAHAALDLGEVEHVVDQPAEPHALAPDDLGVLVGLLGALGPALGEHLAEHRDDRQRGLELVRDIGDELALELVEPALAADRDDEERHRREDHGDRNTDQQRVDELSAIEPGVDHVLLGHAQHPAVDGRHEPGLLHRLAGGVAERRAVAQVALLVADLVQPLGRRRHREELREHVVDEVDEVVLDHHVECPLSGHPLHEREQVRPSVPGAVDVAALADRLLGERQRRHDAREELVAELDAGLARAGRDQAVGDQREVVVEHEHAGRGDAGGPDQLAQVRHRIDLHAGQQGAVGALDPRLDVEDLVVGELLEHGELAVVGRHLAGVGVTVIGEGHRGGQHREDQGVHNENATHWTGILPRVGSVVSAQGC